MDWEIWIQKGDQPWPRKLVIIDRTDADANAKRIQTANYRDQWVPPQYLGGMAQMARLHER